MNDEGLPMMELWVSRDAVETVVRAATSYRRVCTQMGAVNPDVDHTIDTAIESVQEAVKDAWEDPLDVTPF